MPNERKILKNYWKKPVLFSYFRATWTIPKYNTVTTDINIILFTEKFPNLTAEGTDKEENLV